MLATEDRDDGAAPADAYAAFTRGEAQLAGAIADIRSILAGPRIQARCLECGSDAPRVLTRSDRGFLEALWGWLR